jgi:hypothetical protein
MIDNDEELTQNVSISEIEDADYFLIEIEDPEINVEFVLDQETAVWLAKEILERSGEIVDSELIT